MYSILKLYARLALRLYCRRIVINQPRHLAAEGPLLLAANHPNSFLDGIILTTLFDHQVHSLARGDAFQHPIINKLLRRMRLLPVYRTSEGIHNLGHNYTTFDACQRTFEQHGIVLIFSEGRCENEWHLRPLKKGTARLATTAWQKGLPLRVLPVAFNYSSFKRFGKTLHLHFGEVINHHHIDPEASEARQLLDFNALLYGQLKSLVYEIKDGDHQKVRATFKPPIPGTYYLIYALPGLVGWLAHAALYYPIKLFTDVRFAKSGHYDSVLHSLLLIAYPFYLLLLFVLILPHSPVAALATVILMPFLAWAWIQFSEVFE